jgi:hypothetical protein
MSPIVVTYLLYLAITVGLTLWVGRVLAVNGRRVLTAALGDDVLGGAVAALLLVAFYLVTLGVVGLSLRTGADVRTARDALELLAGKIGRVLLILGLIHLGNLALTALYGGRLPARVPAPDLRTPVVLTPSRGR